MIDVQVPSEYLELCEHWHSGLSDLLYAVSSTGNLTLGNRRPFGCETDEQWQVELFNGLASDIHYAYKMANKSGHEDSVSLAEFEQWADNKVAELREVYGLQEWENLA